MSSAFSSRPKAGTSAGAAGSSARFATMCRVRCRQLKSTIWLLFCGVLAMGGAASAHATVRQPTPADSVDQVHVPVDREGTMAVATRGAPSLPFRGVIGFYGDVLVGTRMVSLNSPGVSLDSPIPDGLVYRSTSDSTLAYVPLGNMKYICGPGKMVARSDGVEVIHVRGVGPYYAGYLIPWGDDAYPLFVSAGEFHALWRPTPVKMSKDLLVEIVHDDETQVHGVMGISKGAEQRFYEATPLGPRFLGSEYVAREREYYEPAVGLSGTDGEHYGYHIIPHEPNCGPQMAVVVSAVTGEPVMCGWDHLGPVLVNFDESYPGVEDPVFPIDEPSKSAVSCNMSTRTEIIRANIFELGQHASSDSQGAAP